MSAREAAMLQQVPTSAEARTPVQRTFVTHDGTELFYRVWPTADGVGSGDCAEVAR